MIAKKESTDNRDIVSESAWFDSTAAHWENQYTYPGLRGHLTHKRMALAIEYLNDSQLPAGAKVLDLGCGPGIVAQHVAARGFQVYAVDFSTELLARAQYHLNEGTTGRTYLAQVDAHTLPFKDNVFDAILCIALIVWVTDPAQVLREVARVLRPGGTVIITARNRFCIENVFDPFYWLWRLIPSALRNWLRSRFDRSENEERKKLKPKHFSIRQFDRMLRSAGLEKVKWRTLQYGPFRLLRRRIFPHRLQLTIDKGFEYIWWLPVVRRLGWTYYVQAIRPPNQKNATLKSQ